MGWVVKMPVGKMFTNIYPACVGASCMLFVLLLPKVESLWGSFTYVGISFIVYLGVISLFREERQLLLSLPHIIKKR